NGLGAAAAPEADAPAQPPAAAPAIGSKELRGAIMFSRSRDCGATWSHPDQLSAGVDINQGATIAVAPASGNIYVAWRQFADTHPHVSDAILVARSKDGGRHFDDPVAIAQISPFDQSTSRTSFRTNAYPTMAIDETGRIYV